jgi:hypothetical protein
VVPFSPSACNPLDSPYPLIRLKQLLFPVLPSACNPLDPPYPLIRLNQLLFPAVAV